jgi:hypothetical protein
MKKKENKRHTLKIPPENISFQIHRLTYEDGKKVWDPIQKELSLEIINEREFKCNGHTYVQKFEGSIFNSPSPYVRDIIEMTIEFVKLLNLQEKLESFLFRNGVQSMNEFFERDKCWYNWYSTVNYVYPLTPPEIVDPNYLKHYKFFLPFKLKHVQPENVGVILDYHRNKYYKLDARSFYNIVTRIHREKEPAFWMHKDTQVEIQNWINNNIPEKEKAYWFELIDKYYSATKKSVISLLFHDLKNSDPPFLDPKESFDNFSKIFTKPKNNSTFQKVNWIGSMGELNYFVKTLAKKNKITKTLIWINCSNLFVVNGNEFENKEIGQSSSTSKSRAKELDRIVTQFKATIAQK